MALQVLRRLDAGFANPHLAGLLALLFAQLHLRGGLGVTYKAAANLEIEADFGYTAMRRLEFPDRNYRLRGDNVTWVSLALNTRF
jgi:hypothetical protein